MTIQPNTDYKDQGKVILVKDKEYPLVRTTAKMAFYLDGDKEKRISINKVNNSDSGSTKSTKSKKSGKVSHSNSDKTGPVGNGNFGGHMPNVPESCTHKRVFEDDKGVRWIDNQICLNFCKVKKCDRFKEYKKEIKSTK